MVCCDAVIACPHFDMHCNIYSRPTLKRKLRLPAKADSQTENFGVGASWVQRNYLRGEDVQRRSLRISLVIARPKIDGGLLDEVIYFKKLSSPSRLILFLEAQLSNHEVLGDCGASHNLEWTEGTHLSH